MNPNFQNRWLIRGTLTTGSPVHLGSGLSGECSVPGSQEEMRFNDVCRDHEGLPILPASALRGALRQWVFTALPESLSAERKALFGEPEPAGNFEDVAGGDLGRGGKLEIYDAEVDRSAMMDFSPDPLPLAWDPAKLTGIDVSVVIDRETRAAKEKLLIHEAIVPAGVPFAVEFSGQDLNREEVALFLAALEQFDESGTEALLLGADTGNHRGRLSWKLGAILRIEAVEVSTWLENPDRPAGLGALTPVSEDERHEIEARVSDIRSTTENRADALWRIRLTLAGDGPFLVNDPAVGKNSPGDPKDHNPRMDCNGRVMLPARSFRGVLRSHCEKIARTIFGPDHDAAADTLIDAIFGAGDWKSPIQVTPFVSEPGQRTEDQDMVAIDRFTGGVAGSGKFDFRYVRDPVLSGEITIDAGRWRQKEVHDEAVGLLALAARDLIEGDLTFGMGASKGFGRMRLSRTKIDSVPKGDPLGALLSSWNADAADIPEEAREWLRTAVGALRSEAAQVKPSSKTSDPTHQVP